MSSPNPKSLANPSSLLDLLTSVPKSNKPEILLPSPTPPSAPGPHDPPLCNHIKANGVICGSPALRGRDYCYFHHLWRTRPARQSLRPWNPRIGKLPLLEDANAVQLALQQVLNAILHKRIDLPRARLLLYGLQTASANVLHTNFDPPDSELATDLD
jgi:hypothetical protein